MYNQTKLIADWPLDATQCYSCALSGVRSMLMACPAVLSDAERVRLGRRDWQGDASRCSSSAGSSGSSSASSTASATSCGPRLTPA
eukprot:8275258-Pyramimonas_sp.AAC.1